MYLIYHINTVEKNRQLEQVEQRGHTKGRSRGYGITGIYRDVRMVALCALSMFVPDGSVLSFTVPAGTLEN